MREPYLSEGEVVGFVFLTFIFDSPADLWGTLRGPLAATSLFEGGKSMTLADP
jgi:hypothetical protein